MMPIISQAVKAGIKLSKMDKRAWDKLYFGIRQDIKLGIKHGFGAGSIIGTFIDDASNPFIEDAQVPVSRNVPKTYKQRKGNRRFRYSSGRRRGNKYCPPRNCC